jgi:hypothetical protein
MFIVTRKIYYSNRDRYKTLRRARMVNRNLKLGSSVRSVGIVFLLAILVASMVWIGIARAYSYQAMLPAGGSISYPTPPPPPPQGQVYNGFSGYIHSTSYVQDVIDIMHRHNQNIYRMSFRPSYSPGQHPYDSSLVQYYLQNTPSDWVVIVDANHLTPPDSSTAQQAIDNWNLIRARLQEVLEDFGNDPRVYVEVINEFYVSTSTFYDYMQDTVTWIRSLGYTNPIVFNKLTWIDGRNNWEIINDPLDNTYDGYHIYMDDENLNTIINSMQTAANMGIKVINTETGPTTEPSTFNQAHVNNIETFIQECTNLGFGNCVWLSWDTGWYSDYMDWNFQFVPGS